ncbi:hypothetical protein SUGI_0025720 [Cryptomeria japonica]|nr:hypothetical protein SUGI_0025720 [Cryptomeria japonica]
MRSLSHVAVIICIYGRWESLGQSFFLFGDGEKGSNSFLRAVVGVNYVLEGVGFEVVLSSANEDDPRGTRGGLPKLLMLVRPKTSLSKANPLQHSNHASHDLVQPTTSPKTNPPFDTVPTAVKSPAGEIKCDNLKRVPEGSPEENIVSELDSLHFGTQPPFFGVTKVGVESRKTMC